MKNQIHKIGQLMVLIKIRSRVK